MKSKSGAYTAAALCLGLSTLVQPAHATYIFVIDNFEVTRGGVAFFKDSFSNGDVPQIAPPFAGATPATYLSSQMAGAAASRKTTMESGGSVLNPVGFPNYPRAAFLNTDTSTAMADADKGLKSGYAFSVSGLFNLVAPVPIDEGYGIRLSDKATTDGTDTFTLGIRREADKKLYVSFRQVNISAVTSTTLEKFALDTTHAQILLKLERPDTLSNAIRASFAYVDGGVVGSSQTFTTTPTIFNSVNFTRAGFDAVTPVPLPAAVWLLGTGLVGLIAIGRKHRTH